MNIYLIRHADALPLGESMAGDEERPLSDDGREQSARLAAAFKRLDTPLDRVLTSPLKRSRETADLFAQHLGQPGLEVVDCDELAPGGSARKLFKMLRKLNLQHVALVGHEPDLGRASARLIGSKRAHLEFAKGGVACVLSDDPPRRGTGTLVWMLTPMWLNS